VCVSAEEAFRARGMVGGSVFNSYSEATFFCVDNSPTYSVIKIKKMIHKPEICLNILYKDNLFYSILLFVSRPVFCLACLVNYIVTCILSMDFKRITDLT
jgi:hypothetical protein